MTCGSHTSWQIDGETVTDFISLGSRITVDGDCSHEIKRHLLLGRKGLTNLDRILKSRGITLPTNVCCQSYGFSSRHVWMWELDHKERWVPKNWCFWTVVLEKTLESPLDCKEIQPVHPKEISPGCSLEGLMLKLKLQYFGHLIQRTHSLKKTCCWERLKAGEEGADRGWDGWMASLTWWTWVWASYRAWWWTGKPGVLQCMGSKGLDTTERLNWTEV